MKAIQNGDSVDVRWPTILKTVLGVIPLLLAALVISQVKLNTQVAVMQETLRIHVSQCADAAVINVELNEVRRRLGRLEEDEP